jgi:ABC-type glycerol-3-phosphate transport system substrate-binding protein
VDVCKIIPVRKSLENYYVNAYPEYGKIVVDTVAVGKGAYIVPWVSEMRLHWGPAYEAVMLGKMTPKNAMDNAQKELLAAISQ